MHRSQVRPFSIPVFGVEPADYAGIKTWNVEELARETGSALVRCRHARSRPPDSSEAFFDSE